MDLANTTITRRRNCWFDVLNIRETGVNMMEPMVRMTETRKMTRTTRIMTRMTKVTQHIPTMTDSHHGGFLSVMIMVGICQVTNSHHK